MRVLLAVSFAVTATAGCTKPVNPPAPTSPGLPAERVKPAEPTPRPVVDFSARRAADTDPAPQSPDGPDYREMIAEWDVIASSKMERKLVEIGGRIAAVEKRITGREKQLEALGDSLSDRPAAAALNAELAKLRRELDSLNGHLAAAADGPYGDRLESDRLQIGDFGKLSGPPVFRLVQSIDATNSIMTWPRSRMVFWVEHSPGPPAADHDYRMGGFVHCTGRKRYKTPTGASKTALVIRVID
jgi:hypothetical protein